MISELVRIVEKLQSRTDTGRISLEFPSADCLIVVPVGNDTFPIGVSFDAGQYVVSASKWHAGFGELDHAAAAVCWLLTPYYRIVRSAKVGADIATWIEIYTNAGWEGTEYIYFVPSVEGESPIEDADEIVILTQAVFLDSAFETYYPAAHLDEARYPVGTILGETRFENQNGEWHPVGVPNAE